MGKLSPPPLSPWQTLDPKIKIILKKYQKAFEYIGQMLQFIWILKIEIKKYLNKN